MTQVTLRSELKTVENKLNGFLSSFMREVYISLRTAILEDLLALQIKEFNCD